MQFGLIESVTKALAEPSDRMFGLLTEIRDNLTKAVALLAQIAASVDPGEVETPAPPAKKSR